MEFCQLKFCQTMHFTQLLRLFHFCGGGGGGGRRGDAKSLALELLCINLETKCFLNFVTFWWK